MLGVSSLYLSLVGFQVSFWRSRPGALGVTLASEGHSRTPAGHLIFVLLHDGAARGGSLGLPTIGCGRAKLNYSNISMTGSSDHTAPTMSDPSASGRAGIKVNIRGEKREPMPEDNYRFTFWTHIL
jgi:hypothetical protein